MKSSKEFQQNSLEIFRDILCHASNKTPGQKKSENIKTDEIRLILQLHNTSGAVHLSQSTVARSIIGIKENYI